MADVISAMKPASAVFIDVPNIATGAKVGWRNGLKWERLSQAIAASEVLVGTDLMLANAYVRTWADRDPLEHWSKQAFKTFGRTSFEMKIRTFDDVDSLIIEDMWQTVAKREQESIQNGQLVYPLQVRFVLVSGDSDYLRTIEKMRATYDNNLELELIVFSWSNSLSDRLQEAANKVIRLDDISGFIRKIPTP